MIFCPLFSVSFNSSPRDAHWKNTAAVLWVTRARNRQIFMQFRMCFPGGKHKFFVLPSALKPAATAIASNRVDLPDPFSPTKKVTSDEKIIPPFSASFRTAGRDEKYFPAGSAFFKKMRSAYFPSIPFTGYQNVLPADSVPFCHQH